MPAVSWRCFLQSPYMLKDASFLSNGFFLATCPWRPGLWREQDIVDWRTLNPILDIEPCRSFKVIVGFTVTSRSSFLIAWLLSLDGRLDLGRVLVVWYVLHYLMMDFTILKGMMSDWNVLITLSWMLLLHPFMSDLFWKVFGVHVYLVGWWSVSP